MIDSYNIPWLVWIQMFVFFLLLLLLCLFGIFSSDNSDISFSASSDSVPSSSCNRFLSRHPIPIGLGFSVNSSIVQCNQGIKGEITQATTRRMTRTTEEISEESSSLDKDSSSNLHHPCNLFQLASSAFLKCFGLGDDRSSSSNRNTEETTDDDDDSLRPPESKKQR